MTTKNIVPVFTGHPHLDSVIFAVARMKPGQCLVVDALTMEKIPVLDFRWKPADRVLENIAGSSFEFSWDEAPGFHGGEIIFRRELKPFTWQDGLRTYVSPDQRHHFDRQGYYYKLKEKVDADR